VGRDGGSPRILYSVQGVARPSWVNGTTMVFAEGPDVPELAEVKLLDVKTEQVRTLPGSKSLILPVISSDGHYLAISPPARATGAS